MRSDENTVLDPIVCFPCLSVSESDTTRIRPVSVNTDVGDSL